MVDDGHVAVRAGASVRQASAAEILELAGDASRRPGQAIRFHATVLPVALLVSVGAEGIATSSVVIEEQGAMPFGPIAITSYLGKIGFQ